MNIFLELSIGHILLGMESWNGLHDALDECLRRDPCIPSSHSASPCLQLKNVPLTSYKGSEVI